MVEDSSLPFRSLIELWNAESDQVLETNVEAFHGNLVLDNQSMTNKYAARIISTSRNLTVIGKLAEINSIISGVIYIPEPNWHGLDRIQFAVRDRSNGDAVMSTINVRVTPLNDAPTVSMHDYILLRRERHSQNTTVSLGDDAPKVYDVDDSFGAVEHLKVDIAVGKGKLSMKSFGNLRSDETPQQLSFVGAAKAINNALREAVRYHPQEGHRGLASLDILTVNVTDAKV